MDEHTLGLKIDLARWVQTKRLLKKLVAEVQNEDLPFPIEDEEAAQIKAAVEVLNRVLGASINCMTIHIQELEEEES
jgi:hypothetical protein